MIQIRHNVFETNSSSTHSISINYKTKVRDTLLVDRYGCVDVYDNQFGWDEQVFTDPETRASYAYTFCRNDPTLFDMLTRIIKTHTGATEVCYHDNGGYIDHQSENVCADAFKNDKSLDAFLFNRGSYVQTGNDNG